jgi:hypothetical protein
MLRIGAEVVEIGSRDKQAAKTLKALPSCSLRAFTFLVLDPPTLAKTQPAVPQKASLESLFGCDPRLRQSVGFEFHSKLSWKKDESSRLVETLKAESRLTTI